MRVTLRLLAFFFAWELSMRKAFFFATLSLGLAGGVVGQDVTSSISTSAFDGARFEIIQPPGVRNTTLRLDKFTGNVHRLGTCPKDDSIGSDKCWKEMIVVDLPKVVGGTRPRFQIVINNLLKLTLLLNIDTGQSWQFGIDPLDKWHPFIECTDKFDKNCLWRP